MNLEGWKLKLTAVFEPAPEWGYTCHFEELPEVFSEGESLGDNHASVSITVSTAIQSIP